ncbi:unnamed protein product [Parnassius apollo]|uniref:(apollo) hypothetical protein n=1 Tax=Parnassius apollo TaxID=110799 RepID=A0A8S3Y2Y6_PARAO|nr:unnamed protein product [Parnassius apollo]
MIVLKAEVFNDGRHTGENIAAKLETMLSSWGIPKENVLCIVRDGGTKMKKGISLLIIKNIDCLSHQIQEKFENEEDPLLWWKVNSNKYGILSPVAKEYLVTPPTSVLSERVFSGAKIFYIPHRNRLHGERASKLLFLKFNIPSLQFNY